MSLKKLLTHIFNKLPIRFRCFIQSVYLGGEVQIGRGSYMHSSVHLLGENNIRIGENTCVSEGCWLNVNHRENNKVAIQIGSNCFIGKHNFFTSGDIIEIGDYTLTTIGCKFIGSSHEIGDPEVPYLLTGTTENDKIQIGVNCFLGAGSTVLGNVKVGHGSVIGAGSLVLQDITPFSMAVGNPAKIIKRYSFAQKKWLLASEMRPEDDVNMPNEQVYLKQLKARFPSVKMPWIAAGKNMGDI
jgi:acetyltransferase-like isoleucine patch superfamily enzyme